MSAPKLGDKDIVRTDDMQKAGDEYAAAQRCTNSRRACKTNRRSHREAHQKIYRFRTHVQLRIALLTPACTELSTHALYRRTNKAVRTCANRRQAVHANIRTHMQAYQKSGRFHTHVHLRLDLRTPRCSKSSGHACWPELGRTRCAQQSTDERTNGGYRMRADVLTGRRF